MPWHRHKKQPKPQASAATAHGPSEVKDAAQPTSLWARAFLRLEAQKPDLVKRFNAILTSEAADGAAQSDVENPLPPSQSHMSDLIAKKLSSMNDRQWKVTLGNTPIEVRAQVDRILKIVIVAKDLGSSLASLDPIHAGIPWAGVCVLLPLLLNDSQQRAVAMNGLEEIAKLIRRFSEVENLYLRPGSHRLCKDLEETLTKLYCQILEFEARAVSQFDRNTASQALRNIVKADGWEDLLAAIKESETYCNVLTQIIDTESQYKWNEQIEAMIVEQTAKVEKLLQITDTQAPKQSRQELPRSGTFTGESTKPYREADKAKCIAMLRTTDYEFDKNKNPTRVPGTCEWFLQHPIYRSWLQEGGTGWLWVTANPGCGKSVLARSLIDQFDQSGSNSKTCYFFFKDDSEKNRNINHALCAILHQLLCHDKGLVNHVMDAHSTNGQQLPQLVDVLWTVFLSALEASRVPIICVFDALDECAEAPRAIFLEKLAKYFSTNPSSSKMKILMTSRPNTPIGNAIWRYGLDPLSIQLTGEREVESQAISDEIDLYIAHKVHQFTALRKHRGVLDNAHETLKEKLTKIENRTYLWVSLIFPELEKHVGASKGKLVTIISQIPNTVQEAYERILERSLDRQRARQLLHIVLAATRPMTLREMNVALALKGTTLQLEDLDLDPEASFEVTVRELCGLFVLVKQTQIYLIHQTAKEFLVKVEASDHRDELTPVQWAWKHTFAPDDSHRILARVCMMYLHLNSPRSARDTEMAKHEIIYEYWPEGSAAIWYAFSDYAKSFWARHLGEAELSDADTDTAELLDDRFAAQRADVLAWFHIYEVAPPRKTKTGNKAIHATSLHCHKNMVREFLSTHIATERGLWSMKWAVENNDLRTVIVMLDTMIDKPENAYCLNAALHMASARGHERVVHKLLQSRSVQAKSRDSLGRSALLWAARGGHLAVSEMLLPFFLAEPEPERELVRCLLVASFRGHSNIIDLLLSSRKIGNFADKMVALRWAIRGDFLGSINVLLRNNPAPLFSRHEITIAVLQALQADKFETADLLLEHDIDLEARNENGETPLLVAANMGNTWAAAKILKKGANVNSIASAGWNRCLDGAGVTALYCAVVAARQDMVELLLNYKPNTNIECRDGETALYRAAAESRLEIVRLLLNAGANPLICNQYSLTPAQIARRAVEICGGTETARQERSEMIALLEAGSAKFINGKEQQYHSARQQNLHPNRSNFYPIFHDMLSSLDLEVFDQVLEMDDDSELEFEHNFTRTLIRSFYEQYEDMVLPQSRDALMCGDFDDLRINIGDFLKSNCATLGLRKATDWCDDVYNTDRRSRLWVGCAEVDGDEEEDAGRLRRIAHIFEDIQLELQKLKRKLQDFYYDIQDPRFDAQPEQNSQDAKLENAASGKEPEHIVVMPKDEHTP